MDQTIFKSLENGLAKGYKRNQWELATKLQKYYCENEDGFRKFLMRR